MVKNIGKISRGSENKNKNCILPLLSGKNQAGADPTNTGRIVIVIFGPGLFFSDLGLRPVHMARLCTDSFRLKFYQKTYD